jgi:hypothetical protein
MSKGVLFGLGLGLGCLTIPCVWAIYHMWLDLVSY